MDESSLIMGLTSSPTLTECHAIKAAADTDADTGYEVSFRDSYVDVETVNGWSTALTVNNGKSLTFHNCDARLCVLHENGFAITANTDCGSTVLSPTVNGCTIMEGATQGKAQSVNAITRDSNYGRSKAYVELSPLFPLR